MKPYTDIEQSKKLSEFLPLESEDMFYWCGEDIRLGNYKAMDKDLDVPCWSLTALLDVLPEDIIVLGTVYSINIHTKNKKWFIDYKCNNEEFIGAYSNIFIDACYEMIIKLHKQNLL